jgi:hypothetical protein
MTARIMIGSHAYAVLKGNDFSMDIILDPGRSASVSLIETATEWRAKADRLIRNAERAEAAAQLLKRD